MKIVNLLRNHVRKVISEMFSEPKDGIYFIKYSTKKNIFILYKRFIGFDQYDNKNEQIVLVKELSPDPNEAKIMAKEITGQDLEVKLPSEPKPAARSQMIMPFHQFKGKRLEEIPLGYLIKFILDNKWMSTVKKDPYRFIIYEYLTQDTLPQTELYLNKSIKGTNTPDLVDKYNEYVSKGQSFGKEGIVFANLMIPILKNELLVRKAMH